MNDEPGPRTIAYGLVAVAIFGILFVGGCSLIVPKWGIYSQRAEGQAELARAESNRQIKICEAMAHKESAKALAEAEIIRAEGVARANQIIGDSLKGNESYLRYLWINGLQHNGSTVVYVPTECNLPILEANRLRSKPSMLENSDE